MYLYILQIDELNLQLQKQARSAQVGKNSIKIFSVKLYPECFCQSMLYGEVT